MRGLTLVKDLSGQNYRGWFSFIGILSWKGTLFVWWRWGEILVQKVCDHINIRTFQLNFSMTKILAQQKVNLTPPKGITPNFYCQKQNWKWSDFFYRNAEPSRMCLVLHVWLCKPPTSIWEAHVWILLKPWKFCLFSPHAVAQVSGNLWGSFIYFICLHRSNEIYFCKKLCKAWNS